MGKVLDIRATVPQAEFHASTKKHPLFVGGYGSGKSEALINQATMDALESPNAVIGIYEPTYQLVNDIILDRMMIKLSDWGLGPNINKKDMVITTSHPQCGKFILRTLDKPERIVGYETYKAHIDEIDTLPIDKANKAWEKITARNRQQPQGIDNIQNRVSAYTTPEGFRFAYNQWVVNKTDKYHDVIQASSYSNPFLPEGYIDALKAIYPAELINAYINGEFVNLTSGTVYRTYDRDKNSSDEVVKDNETLYIGMDFNVDNMAATIYVKRHRLAQKTGMHKANSVARREDVWHCVDEISEEYDTKSVAKLIREKYPKNKVIIYPDSSGKNRSTNAGAAESDIATLQSAPFKFECRYRSTNPRVKDRIMAMNAALEKGLVKFNTVVCKRTVECLEQQAYDKNGQPDKSSGVDHQNDATTYPIAYEMAIRKPAAVLPVQWY